MPVLNLHVTSVGFNNFSNCLRISSIVLIFSIFGLKPTAQLFGTREVVYLVQSDVCVDLEFLHSKYSFVLHLIWKEPPGPDCQHAIYMPDSTWAQRRNRLYKELYSRYHDESPHGHSFAYIIMMDGDVLLRETCTEDNVRLLDKSTVDSSANAARTFESYLFQYHPAVGVPVRRAPDYCDKVEVIWDFDQAVVAIHVDAVPLMLPYVESFQESDGQRSGAILNALCAVAYPEDCLQFNAVEVLRNSNRGHEGGGDREQVYSSLFWFLPSIRRLTDYLNARSLVFDDESLHHSASENSIKVNMAKNPSRDSAGSYLRKAAHGLFDPCHSFFQEKEKFYADLCCFGACSMCAFAWNSKYFSFGSILHCAAEATIFDYRQGTENRGEHYFLFLQELGRELIRLDYQLFAPPSFCPASLPSQITRPIELRVLYPQHNQCIDLRPHHDLLPIQVDIQNQFPWTPDGPRFVVKIRLRLLGSDWFWFDELTSGAPQGSSGVGMPPVRPAEWDSVAYPPSACSRLSFVVQDVPLPVGQLVLEIIVTLVADLAGDEWVESTSGLNDIDDSASMEVVASTRVTFTVTHNSYSTLEIDQLSMCKDPSPAGEAGIDASAQGEPAAQEGGNHDEIIGEFQIAYLVQHDECLDLSHLHTKYSVVILLTRRRPPVPDCPAAIFYPNSTLVQGRNRLYKELMDRHGTGEGGRLPFRYIVMMDGNVRLVEAADFGRNTGHAWRTFEIYLKEFEPAVGVPHSTDRDYDEMSEAQLVFNFDQIVVAYHIEATQLLLPYTEVFDDGSLWGSGAVQNALCAAAYNEHRMQFNALKALSLVNGSGGEGRAYIQAFTLGQPLRWIATAFISTEAVLCIPWHNYCQYAVMGDHWYLDCLRAPVPKKKYEQNYNQNLSRVFDFCHEYFDYRQAHFPCGIGRNKGHNSPHDQLTVIISHIEALRSHIATIIIMCSKGSDGDSEDEGVDKAFGTNANQRLGWPDKSLSVWDRCRESNGRIRSAERRLEVWLHLMRADRERLHLDTHKSKTREVGMELDTGCCTVHSNQSFGLCWDCPLCSSNLSRPHGESLNQNLPLSWNEQRAKCVIDFPKNLSLLPMDNNMSVKEGHTEFEASCLYGPDPLSLPDVSTDQECSFVLKINDLIVANESCSPFRLHMHGSPSTFQFRYIKRMDALRPGVNQLQFRMQGTFVQSDWTAVIFVIQSIELLEGECVPEMILPQPSRHSLPSLHHLSSLSNLFISLHTIQLQPPIKGCEHHDAKYQVQFFAVNKDQNISTNPVAVMYSVSESVNLTFDSFGWHLMLVEFVSSDGNNRLLGSQLLTFELERTTLQKDFCYLVQASEYVKVAHLKTPNSEVIQLIWRSWLHGDNPPQNEYLIFFPNSTHAQGRNRLFRAVRELFPNTEFRYLLMMDDDVDLVEWRDFGRNTGNAWRTFERYLIEWEPAVGVPSYVGSSFRRPEAEVQTIFAFDQIVVAYHWETLSVLLPYTEVFDEKSWWYCSTVQHVLCSVLFPNHTISFNAVEACNTQHRYHGVYKRGRSFNTPLNWIASAFINFKSLANIPFDDPTRQMSEAVPTRRDERPIPSYLTVNPTLDFDCMMLKDSESMIPFRFEYDHRHPYFAQRRLLQPFARHDEHLSESEEVTPGVWAMGILTPLVTEQRKELLNLQGQVEELKRLVMLASMPKSEK